MTVFNHPKIHDRLSADLPRNAVVAVTLVDDPLEPGAKINVLRQLRNDPLAGMHARGQIDDAKFAAGRLWQRYYEHSEIGSIQAIDPTKEAVDGGCQRDPITDRQLKAFRALAIADHALGAYGCSLVRDVLVRRMTILDAARARVMSRQREVEFLGMRFRECLEALAKLWGLA